MAVATGLLTLGFCANAGATGSIELAGDVLEIVLPVGAGGLTSVNLLGGAGSDHITLAGSNHIAASGQSFVNIDGAAGDDLLSFSYNGALVNGQFHLTTDGGIGNDVIVAILILDPRSTGTVDAQVLGGRGRDDLTLEIYGCPEDHTTALIDGGDGIDTAHFTPNVRVVNCERIG